MQCQITFFWVWEGGKEAGESLLLNGVDIGIGIEGILTLG